ncbi:MAG: hypothetical protein QF701_05140 [Nitrospinota bacterium]|jgi:hypothetical protein|nr:hypothetical protein [Nitrospinota bacterium]MDP7167128.1 hypothetical protein [Nitrospinota bacterium]MDP7369337.1 hypothetical protein [Nitrospinota bacterium]MDP7504513.1 hypothetical protein [Nitrospinota bacterium]MDP7664273.1 hypothetical protein [Nitrospinota bacterium]|tara:strand:- start:18 stop:545 length:528 start_codon:yes stop_codon:yes gene_type:complete
MTLEVESKGVDYYKAADGRVIAIHVKGDFSDYAKFPPYLDTEEAQEHIRTAYAGQDIDEERNTKAHMTDDEIPLQVIVLNRPKGAVTKAHYHLVEERPSVNTTRHQILLCQRGKVRVGVFTKEGDYLGDAILNPGDLILMYEGHEVEFLEDDTKLIEIKEGPFPETDDKDKVELA